MKKLLRFAREIHIGLALILACLLSLEFHVGHDLLMAAGWSFEDFRTYPVAPFKLGGAVSFFALSGVFVAMRWQKRMISDKVKRVVAILAAFLILGNEAESLYYREYSRCVAQDRISERSHCGLAPSARFHFVLFDNIFRIRYFIDAEHDRSPRVLFYDNYQF